MKTQDFVQKTHHATRISYTFSAVRRTTRKIILSSRGRAYIKTLWVERESLGRRNLGQVGRGDALLLEDERGRGRLAEGVDAEHLVGILVPQTGGARLDGGGLGLVAQDLGALA